jgi:putative ABC transport system ATP-binding protein
VELPLVYRGVPAKERRAAALEALGAVGLAERVHHTPNQLSGGQQQRVAIARALVTRPPMLLADEPTGNLDTRTSLEVLALLQRLNRERGITVVLVTHEHDIAACASRVVTFRDGKIISDVREPPIDALAELERVPPPDAAGADADDQEDAAAAERRRVGGPVPRALYAVMALGGLLGLLAGTLYARAILDVSSTVVPLVFAFLFEAMAAVFYARRALPRPLTNDQRTRIALMYTLALAVLLAGPTALGWMPWSKALLDRFEAFSSAEVALAALLAGLGIATVALARYLVIALFAPLLAPHKSEGGRSEEKRKSVA